MLTGNCADADHRALWATRPGRVNLCQDRGICVFVNDVGRGVIEPWWKGFRCYVFFWCVGQYVSRVGLHGCVILGTIYGIYFLLRLENRIQSR
jgi:hypothetical protein